MKNPRARTKSVSRTAKQARELKEAMDRHEKAVAADFGPGMSESESESEEEEDEKVSFAPAGTKVTKLPARAIVLLALETEKRSLNYREILQFLNANRKILEKLIVSSDTINGVVQKFNKRTKFRANSASKLSNGGNRKNIFRNNNGVYRIDPKNAQAVTREVNAYRPRGLKGILAFEKSQLATANKTREVRRKRAAERAKTDRALKKRKQQEMAVLHARAAIKAAQISATEAQRRMSVGQVQTPPPKPMASNSLAWESTFDPDSILLSEEDIANLEAANLSAFPST